MYRSFVTCDDPNGVVECGSIRRFKKMEPNIEKGQSKSKSWHRPSSLQLMEVSDGAQKLNQVINSWSKGEKHEKDSKDLAKDLLKGALDLQESLVMLGKLQEASKHTSKLKEKRKSDISRVDASSFRFQNPCFSTEDDDSTEELKKVIRESLTRHNLLNGRNNEENDSFSGRNFDSASNLPSTSSSQSSMIRTSNFSSTDSLISSAASQKKAKGPNLIAKLMGVEEFPSKPMPISPNQQRPVFDIEKPRFLPKRRTLGEILETTYCGGISEGNRFKEFDSRSHHFHDSFPRQKPLIVLIKPVRVPWSKREIEKPSSPVFGEPRERTREEVEVSLNPYRSINKIVAGETTRRRISHDGIKTKQNFSSNLKNSSPRVQQQEKKGESEKKSSKVLQRHGTNGAKPEEKRIVAKTKVTPIKTHDSRKQGSALDSIYTSKTRAIPHDTNDRKRSSSVKKEKRNTKPTPAKKITENPRRKGDDKRINLNSENEGKESSENQIGDYCNDDQCSVEIIPLIAERHEDAKSSEVVDDDRIRPRETATKSTLKALLLRNPAFLNHAKELLDLNANVPTTSETYNTVDGTDAEAKLFLDCANEIVQCRSKPFRFMRINVSLDQLLDEVCQGVDTLRSYSEVASKSDLTDNLQTALERDIWHKENMLSGIWDLGWRNGFSGDEMENIVYDLETQILTALVEEVCS